MEHRPAKARGRFGGVTRGWLLLMTLLAIAPAGALALSGNAQDSSQSCLGRAATLTAVAGKELNGSPRRDVIVGSGGIDRIEGGGGNDLICAGAGADVVSGGDGNDRILGGAGTDFLRGNAGDDRIEGGKGRDRCRGGGGSDELTSCEKGMSRGTRRESRTQSAAQENRVPLAKDLATSTDEDSPKSIAVAELASDGDGESLSIASVNSSETVGTVAIVAGGGALKFDPTGRFDSLAPSQSATDSFRYTVTDGRGGTASARVTISVSGVDDSPQAVDDQASLQEGAGATALAARDNDTDVDGGPKLIASVTQPAHGTAEVGSEGLDVSYQPNSGYCNDGEALDSFTYTLNGGSTATVGVAVACVSVVSTDQDGLFPAFDPNVHDYTVKCTGAPLEVSGRLAQGSSISVDGNGVQTGAFTTSVPLAENQEFTFSLSDGTATSDYHVRCLPTNFPAWEFEALRPLQHQFYMVDPAIGAGGTGYAIVFDDHGVPVWWQGSSPGPIDAKFISEEGQPTRLTWWGQFGNADGYQIHELDGTVVHTVSAVGGSTDIHELQREPNGDYLVISYQPREHVDLTAFGGGADDTVIDAEVQEINAAGQAVWTWNSSEHIGLGETGRWWPTVLKGSSRDIVHMNAIEPVGDDAILISLRHTDAVYRIDKATGDVVWKLGGTWTPMSLNVTNDPQGAYPLGGQHDVRLQPDGTITLHDNDTNLPSPPRVVRYEIDEGTHTAKLVEQKTDPEAPGSFCCGSARRSADGSWLISWGGRSLVTEFNPAGERTFKLGFGGIPFSYRAVGAPDNALSAAALRAGMDAMHPRTP